MHDSVPSVLKASSFPTDCIRVTNRKTFVRFNKDLFHSVEKLLSFDNFLTEIKPKNV